MLGFIFFLPVATGFLVGFFVSSRIVMMCLVPVAVIVVNIAYAMLVHGGPSLIAMAIGIAVAYPTALSINRFMHD